MTNLLSRDRAKKAINQTTFTAAENAQVDELVAAVSRAARNYCHRDFALGQYDELHGGDGSPHLFLRQAPVVAVERVLGSPVAGLTVTNTDSTTNQRATVAVTASGLTLTRVASGVTTIDTSVTWSSYATLTAVAAAVNALGNGWSATVAAGLGGYPSADLRAIQGALGARYPRSAALAIHAEEIADYEVDAEAGVLTLRSGEPDATASCYRVVYTAGYDGVPEDVQEACAQWAAALFWAAKDNPARAPASPPASVALLLGPYRRMVI